MILRTPGGGEVKVARDATLGSLIRASGGELRSSPGPAVTERAVLGLPAWIAAVRIASQAVASLRFRVWRGDGLDRALVTSSWQAKLFAGVPNEREDWFSLLSQHEASMTNANNAFWLKALDPASGLVSAVYVLAPQNVQVRWNIERQRKEFRVRNSVGVFSDWVDSSVILHVRALNLPGLLVDPTPLELHRDTLAAAVAKPRFEATHYEDGVQQKLAVTFPENVTPEQGREWREVFESEHAGAGNRNKVAVFGGGAKVDTIGLTLEDSQYIESMRFSIEDTARLTGVLASLLGGGSGSGGDKPLSPEHEQTRWLRYGVGPRLERLERAVNADPSLFGPGARTYLMADTGAFVRGDLATEAEISLKKVQSGQWLVDEARAKDGLPPLPDGAGQVPQITPVGGAPNHSPQP